MPPVRARIAAAIAQLLFADHARPVEWLSALSLAWCAQLFLTTHQLFTRAGYSAFLYLPPRVWGLVFGVVALVHLAGMWPGRAAGTLRFVGMAFAAGAWSVIALNFWSSDSGAPFVSRLTTVVAMAAAATALYLGALGGRRP